MACTSSSSNNFLDVEFVRDRTVATRVHSSFPLRLMLPKHRSRSLPESKSKHEQEQRQKTEEEPADASHEVEADGTTSSDEYDGEDIQPMPYQEHEDSFPESLWCYMLNFGGGLLQGDHVTLNVNVGERCSLVLASQGSTKVYKARRKCLAAEEEVKPCARTDEAQEKQDDDASQELQCAVGPGALLALMPQPLTCFRGAKYRQRQRFELSGDGTSSLLLIDWVTAGRGLAGGPSKPHGADDHVAASSTSNDKASSAEEKEETKLSDRRAEELRHEERWAFASLSSRNEVFLGDRLVFLDPLLLTNPSPAPGGYATDRNEYGDKGRADADEEADPQQPPQTPPAPPPPLLCERMNGAGVFGFALLVGPAFEAAADHIRRGGLMDRRTWNSGGGRGRGRRRREEEEEEESESDSDDDSVSESDGDADRSEAACAAKGGPGKKRRSSSSSNNSSSSSNNGSGGGGVTGSALKRLRSIRGTAAGSNLSDVKRRAFVRRSRTARNDNNSVAPQHRYAKPKQKKRHSLRDRREPHLPLLSASDVYLEGGDEHSQPGLVLPSRGGGGGGGGSRSRRRTKPALVLRWAAEATEDAHEVLLEALEPVRERLGRLPFGSVAV